MPQSLKKNWWAKITEDAKSGIKSKSSRNILQKNTIYEPQLFREVNVIKLVDEQKQRMDKIEKRNLLNIISPVLVSHEPVVIRSPNKRVEKSEKLLDVKDSVSRAHEVSNKEMYFNSPKQTQEQQHSELG